MTTSRRITEARRGGRRIHSFVRAAIASRSKNSRKRRINHRDKDLPIDWCWRQLSRDIGERRSITWRHGWPSTLRAGGRHRPISFRYTAKWANWISLFIANFVSCSSFMFLVHRLVDSYDGRTNNVVLFTFPSSWPAGWFFLHWLYSISYL